MSPVQLAKGGFLSTVEKTINQTGILPHELEIEITEYSLMDESIQTHRLLDDLKTLGVSIALDDFGTGYSSLSYLTKYPINTLKIDRSIVFDAYKNDSSSAVLHNIFLLAHSLKMQVVTEGIESIEQLQLVNKYTNDLIQGYLFCKPLPLDELVAFYNKEDTDTIGDMQN